MTWPFENDTSAITKKLAKKSLQSEKRRNLMVVIAVALAAFLICFTGIVSTSLTQMQRNQVVDTYEAVWLGVEENDIETLKGLPEFERVGGYYMLGEELSEQGYHASYVYCDAQMMEITKAQMELLEGRVPEKANEVVVSEYFLSTYGNNAKIGDTVTLDTESFHGDYVVTGIMDSVNEKEANTCAIILSNAAMTGWKGFDPTGCIRHRKQCIDTAKKRCSGSKSYQRIHVRGFIQQSFKTTDKEFLVDDHDNDRQKQLKQSHRHMVSRKERWQRPVPHHMPHREIHQYQ